MLQSDAQDTFNMLAWGIEAVQDSGTHNVSNHSIASYHFSLANP